MQSGQAVIRNVEATEGGESTSWVLRGTVSAPAGYGAAHRSTKYVSKWTHWFFITINSMIKSSLPDILISHQYISRCALDGSHLSDILSGSVPCCCYPVDVFLSLTRFQVCIQFLYGLSFHSRNHFLCSTFCSFVLVPVIIFSGSFLHL